MTTPPTTASQCYVPKSKEEEEQVEKTYARYREAIIPALPRQKGWMSEHSYKYQGFWFDSDVGLEGVMYLQEHFKPRSTDVLVASYPKCGTTWLKALIFSVMNRSTYADTRAHPLLLTSVHECVPFLDLHLFRKTPVGDPEILPSPRLLCTHIPYLMLPKSARGPGGCRIVHMWRNPKDVVISFWHFASSFRRKAQLPELSLGEAFELFAGGASPYGPFWDQVLGYWRASRECPEKILFLKYEDMKRDAVAQVKRLAEFLGRPFTAEEEESGALHDILELCSFKNMSQAEVLERGTFHEGPNYQYFFRKGEVGDSKNHLTEEMVRRLDEITEEKFKGSGLTV